ncbi:MAG TPA: ABC transporter permease [Bryobacteraceae bacterium]|nr:ABC transporter permease [Bryobacteraceae bacterium]
MHRITDAISHVGPRFGALFALVILVVGNVLFTPSFATSNNFWSSLLQVSPTVLVALGMTMVMATGGIDLSVGSLMAIASAAAATSLESGAGLAVLAALAITVSIGAANGAIISGLAIQPIIVTLAVLISARGAAQIITEGQLVPFSHAGFEFLGRGYIGPVPFQVLVMVAAAAGVWILMEATVFGRYILAIGGNQEAARLSGVRIFRDKVAVYAVSGLLAGLAGLIETARLGASDAAKIGLNIELDAIAAAVVGGTALTGGRAMVVGTVVGALIMQVITTSFNMRLIPYSWSLVWKAAIILIGVIVQRPRKA